MHLLSLSKAKFFDIYFYEYTQQRIILQGFFFRNINAIYGFLDNKQSYLIKGLKIIHIKNIEAAKGSNQSITSH